MQKEEILAEIRRTAKENGGKPLGANRFAAETSIKPYDWHKYWARFGDAQQEAGFTPNRLTSAYSEEFLIEKFIVAMRKLGKFPTTTELRLEKNDDAEFPYRSLKERLNTKHQFVAGVIEYSKNKDGYNDIVELCMPVLKKALDNQESEQYKDNGQERIGEVYLFKSGRYYKIGMTNDTVRRGSELRIQLPEKMDLIHSIKTDDPSGVEAYWHRRFDTKRLNGEWFDLSSSDIKAFKRWRRIY